MQESQIEINGLQVYYKAAGEGQPILILHGWRSSSSSWVKVQEMLGEKGYQVIVPDLPGFGKTPPPPPKASARQGAPKEVWGVEEYADFVNQFVEQLGLEKFVLAGHSFGGQIAVQFAAIHSDRVKKLILVAPAAIRRKPTLETQVFALIAKTGSAFVSIIPSTKVRELAKKVLYRSIGRRDYARAEGVMRHIFQKIKLQDMSSLLPKITAPTLMLWGNRDEMTPIQDAYLMQELIPGAMLQIIEGGNHALNLQTPEKLSNFILEFLKKP